MVLFGSSSKHLEEFESFQESCVVLCACSLLFLASNSVHSGSVHTRIAVSDCERLLQRVRGGSIVRVLSAPLGLCVMSLRLLFVYAHTVLCCETVILVLDLRRLI